MRLHLVLCDVVGQLIEACPPDSDVRRGMAWASMETRYWLVDVPSAEVWAASCPRRELGGPEFGGRPTAANNETTWKHQVTMAGTTAGQRLGGGRGTGHT